MIALCFDIQCFTLFPCLLARRRGDKTPSLQSFFVCSTPPNPPQHNQILTVIYLQENIIREHK